MRHPSGEHDVPSVRLRREATDSSDESVFLDVFANNGTEVVVLEKTVTNNGTDFYLVVVKDGRSREKGFVKSEYIVRREREVHEEEGASDGESDSESEQEETDGAESEPEFLVEEIVGHRRGKGGRWEFEVKWEGEWPSTWEPRSNLGANLVLRAYLATHPLK